MEEQEIPATSCRIVEIFGVSTRIFLSYVERPRLPLGSRDKYIASAAKNWVRAEGVKRTFTFAALLTTYRLPRELRQGRSPCLPLFLFPLEQEASKVRVHAENVHTPLCLPTQRQRAPSV